MNVHSISQNHVILPNISISSATWSLFRPACITKCVMYGIVLVKNVKIVFTLKQIYFSFPAQTAVSLGTVFPRTLPRDNTRNTSSAREHCECSSSDAECLIVDICRQAKCHNGCEMKSKLNNYNQNQIKIILM